MQNLSDFSKWIKRADQDFELAKITVELENAVYFKESIIYHCQQSAEKYLKAWCFKRNITFKFTHDLELLLELLREEPQISHDLHLWCDEINKYGNSTRYPMSEVEILLEDAKEAFYYLVQIRNYVKPILENN